MAPVFELPPLVGGGVGDTVVVEDALKDVLEEDVGVIDPETPEGLRIEPGPSSGESIKRRRMRP
jgi:hypothetical protein